MFRKENLTNQLQKCFFLTTKKKRKTKKQGYFFTLEHWNSLNWNSQIPWTYTRVPWKSCALVQRKPWYWRYRWMNATVTPSRFTLVSRANYRRKQMMCCGVPPNEIPPHCMLKRPLRKNLHQCFWILPNTRIAVQIIVKWHHVGFLNQSGKAEMTKFQIWQYPMHHPHQPCSQTSFSYACCWWGFQTTAEDNTSEHVHTQSLTNLPDLKWIAKYRKNRVVQRDVSLAYFTLQTARNYIK